MGIRRCKQCGELKTEINFRQYYKNNAHGERLPGRYKVCLVCERLNNRFKYLTKKKERSQEETTELNKIAMLYEILRERGLEPPGTKDTEQPFDLDAEIEKHKKELERERSAVPESGVAVPQELLEWLEKSLVGYAPDYLQDVVAEDLLKKYRPQTGVDPVTLRPVYDDTYRDVLNKILKRFDDYEDEHA